MATDEDSVIGALTGFSLNNILGELHLPGGGSALSNRLGITGLPSLNPRSIYADDWAGTDDEGAVGVGEGDDWEDEVDKELEDEMDSVKQEEEELSGPPPAPERRVRVVRRLVERPKTVYERFPAFEKDKTLDFSELFKGQVVKKSRINKRPFHVETWYPRRREVPRSFLESVVGGTQKQQEDKTAAEAVASGNVEDDLRQALKGRELESDALPIPLNDRSFDLILLSNWEDQIIYGPKGSAAPNQIAPSEGLTTPINKVLESGAWTQSIIWSPTVPFRDFTQIEFNHEDDVVPEERPAADGLRPRKRTRADAAQVKDKFNLSNDHHYEISAKEGARQRVRQTFGQLVVEHAYPAQKLQLPFYKTRLSKQEARSWHRPALQFPLNVELRFSKVRTAKKKKDKAGRKLGKGGNIGEGLRKTGDLSLQDTSNFVLWELSEEHPPIMSSFGMGSILVNYYRKKNENDDHIPKYDLGVPFVLDPTDDSPFMRFGNVIPGQTIPTLYNNLIRAPLFRHKAYPTDFLVVRSTTKGESKYFIREIKNLFVVGQTYPVTEVPGPHSRKITNTIKYRLQTIACKLLAKSPGERLKISRLMKYFPDQNELQMRQRLKEFMEYHRRGEHQGFWRLKTTWPVPSAADMLKMVGPEQVVLTESMQVGQRHLQDLGYSQSAEGGDGDESHLSVEQQLAPWITTKNFLLATQAKAMLRLHGDGDPSGRGEAFSMLRVSMKDIFVKAGEDYEQKLAEAEARPKSAHKYNVAEQQQIYRSEVDRIWKAQYDSLSRKEEPELSDHEEEPPKQIDFSKAQRRLSVFAGAQEEGRAHSPPAASPVAQRYSIPPSPAFSRGSSLEREGSLGPDSAKKVLRIKRMVDGEWKYEIVRDPAVIAAYVRKRQTIEEETTLADTLAPTGDAERDARAKKRLEEEIARMKKNQERRLHRKNAKIVKEGGMPMQLNRPMKPDTTRRCGHCGQMGHMKTNRKCPRWAEFNSPNAPPPLTPSAASPVASGSSGGSTGTQADNVLPPSLTSLRTGAAAFAPSPLATSPPMSAMETDDGPVSPVAPKLKLTIGGKK